MKSSIKRKSSSALDNLLPSSCSETVLDLQNTFLLLCGRYIDYTMPEGYEPLEGSEPIPQAEAVPQVERPFAHLTRDLTWEDTYYQDNSELAGGGV